MEKNPSEKVYYTPNPAMKKSSVNRRPLLYGLFLGIVLFAAIYAGLYYSGNIASPKNLIKNKQTTVNNISPVLQEKAKKAGYQIIWQGDPNDTTGRTILASKERNYAGAVDVLGWYTANDLYKDRVDVFRGTGIFQKIENIPNSKDKYIYLINPFDNSSMKARVSLNKADFGENACGSSKLWVEDLRVLSYTSENSYSQLIDEFENIKESTIRKIIKENDVITLHVCLIQEDKLINNKLFAVRDENNSLVATQISIRRFEGISQIKKEMD